MIFLVKLPQKNGPLSYIVESPTQMSLVFRGRAVAFMLSTPSPDWYIAFPVAGERFAAAAAYLDYVKSITEEEAAVMDDPERFAGHKLSWWESFKKLVGLS